MVVDLRSGKRSIMWSDSSSLRKFSTFSFDLPQRAERKDKLTFNWPLLMDTRYPFIRVLHSSWEAMINKSIHHFNFSASWNIQCLVIFLCSFIHPSIAFDYIQ